MAGAGQGSSGGRPAPSSPNRPPAGVAQPRPGSPPSAQRPPSGGSAGGGFPAARPGAAASGSGNYNPQSGYSY